jgi:hypothetical protein
MLIQQRAGFSNIGKRLDGREWITQKWNPRYHQTLRDDDTGLPGTGGAHWLLRRGIADAYSWARATDANRNWTTPYQDIVVVFNAKMQDTGLTPGNPATGHTISKNGSPQTTNYQSGSGTGTWVLRVPVALTADDVLTYSYNPAVGNTTSVQTGAELTTATARPVNNMLTKRIRMTLKGSDNNPVVSEAVKTAVLRFHSGMVEGPGDNAGGIWMCREMQCEPYTDVNGLLDFRYTGVAACRASVYVVIYRPTESMCWQQAVD